MGLERIINNKTNSRIENMLKVIQKTVNRMKFGGAKENDGAKDKE